MRLGLTAGLPFFAMAVLSQGAESELYNLDFTPPENGTYQTVFGQPTIVPSVAGFQDAMVFEGFTSYEQIRLPVGGVGRQYEIDFDLLAHNLLNSEYAFSIFLDYDPDLRQYRSISFHGGNNNIATFSPDISLSGAPVAFSDDQAYHLGISLDFDARAWSLDVDGAQTFIGSIAGENLEAIRFSMAPWVGGAVNDPSAYAALDNVVVRVVPEPSPTQITLGGLALLMLIRRLR